MGLFPPPLYTSYSAAMLLQYIFLSTIFLLGCQVDVMISLSVLLIPFRIWYNYVSGEYLIILIIVQTVILYSLSKAKKINNHYINILNKFMHTDTHTNFFCSRLMESFNKNIYLFRSTTGLICTIYYLIVLIFYSTKCCL